MTSNGGGLYALVRKEAREAKEYSRLAPAPELGPPRYGLHALFGAGCLAALALALALVPIERTYRSYGAIVNPTAESMVVRAPRSGQVLSIAAVGTPVNEGEEIALVETKIRTEDGQSAYALATSSVSQIQTARRQDLALIDERMAVSKTMSEEAIRNSEIRLSTLNGSIKRQAEVLEKYERTADSIAGQYDQYVSRLELLGITERAATARSRLEELRREATRIELDMQQSRRDLRIAEINAGLERSRLNRQYGAEEQESIARSTEGKYQVSSPRNGFVHAVYKRAGDWVGAGDEVATISDSLPERGGSLRVSLELPPHLVNSVSVGQRAKAWLQSENRLERPLSGTVEKIDQRTREAARLMDSTESASPAGFFATVVISDSGVSTKTSAPKLGSRVLVELTLDYEPLYAVLVPKRRAQEAKKAE